MPTMNVPNPGSLVEIEVNDPLARGHIPPGPETRRFHGEVLPSYRWLTDREFCVTGDERWPVRVINLASVRSIKVISGSTRQVQTQNQTFTIKGSRGDTYMVTRSPAGWHCQCKGFEFRGRCRHIQEAQK